MFYYCQSHRENGQEYQTEAFESMTLVCLIMMPLHDLEHLPIHLAVELSQHQIADSQKPRVDDTKIFGLVI